jgi:hypothetical protein
MSAIRIYRNPTCARCARIAHFHKLFDIFHRVEISTATPKSGPLIAGEIVVEDIVSGRISQGFEAFAAICRAIPFYYPIRLFFVFPAFRRAVAREISAGKLSE